MSFPHDIDKLHQPTFPRFSLEVEVIAGRWHYTITKPNQVFYTGSVVNVEEAYHLLDKAMRDWLDTDKRYANVVSNV